MVVGDVLSELILSQVCLGLDVFLVNRLNNIFVVGFIFELVVAGRVLSLEPDGLVDVVVVLLKHLLDLVVLQELPRSDARFRFQVQAGTLQNEKHLGNFRVVKLACQVQRRVVFFINQIHPRVWNQFLPVLEYLVHGCLQVLFETVN